MEISSREDWWYEMGWKFGSQEYDAYEFAKIYDYEELPQKEREALFMGYEDFLGESRLSNDSEDCEHTNLE